MAQHIYDLSTYIRAKKLIDPYDQFQDRILRNAVALKEKKILLLFHQFLWKRTYLHPCQSSVTL